MAQLCSHIAKEWSTITSFTWTSKKEGDMHLQYWKAKLVFSFVEMTENQSTEGTKGVFIRSFEFCRHEDLVAN